MMKAFKKKRKGGFTLIELIVVIAIIGILAAIAAPRLLGFTNTAKIAADDALMETMNKALFLLDESNGAAPADADDNTPATLVAFLKTQNMLEADAAFNFPASYSVSGTLAAARITKP